MKAEKVSFKDIEEDENTICVWMNGNDNKGGRKIWLVYIYGIVETVCKIRKDWIQVFRIIGVDYD